jgi:hypothetical protein
MGHERLLGSARCPRPMSFLRPFAGWMTCAPLETLAANAGRVSRGAQRFLRLIRYQWLGSFGNRGNGHYREELRKGLSAIKRYLTAHQLTEERTLVRLDGHYGTGAVLTDVAGFAFVTRGKEYSVLDHPQVQARLCLPPDQFQQRPRSARWYAASTITHRSRWDQMAHGAVSSWQPIRRAKRRALLGSRVLALSTNCSSRTYRNRHSPPAMSSNSPCFAAPLSLS